MKRSFWYWFQLTSLIMWEVFREGRAEYCDRDYIQPSIVIMGLTRLGYNFTDYLLHYILSTEADTHTNCSPGHNPRAGGSGSDPSSCLSADPGHPGLTSWYQRMKCIRYDRTNECKPVSPRKVVTETSTNTSSTSQTAQTISPTVTVL